MIPSDPHPRIAVLERELAWAHLKIQSLTEELRQQRVKLLGPRSETLSDLQLQQHGMRWRRKHGGRRSRLSRRANGVRIRGGNACPRICRVSRK